MAVKSKKYPYRNPPKAPSFQEYANAKQMGRTGPGPIPQNYGSIAPPILQQGYTQGYQETHPPGPTTPRGSGAPSTPTPAPRNPLSAPLSMEEQAARTAADEQYGINQGDYGHQLYGAAFRYGDRDTMAQYSQYGPVVDNPNSALATIGRTTAANVQGEKDVRERANTYFSGMHLKQQNEIQDQANRERLAAFQEYQDAVGRINVLKQQSEADKAQVYGKTGGTAIDRYLGQDPEPLGPEAPSGAGGTTARPGSVNQPVEPTSIFRGSQPMAAAFNALSPGERSKWQRWHQKYPNRSLEHWIRSGKP